MFGTQFYPTPAPLAEKMIACIKHPNRYRKVLDPEAGRGDLLRAYSESDRLHYHHRPILCAVEIDPDLQNVLSGKGIRLIDSDWLAFSGFDQFDLILMNPPFQDGDKHLLKAIDILVEGEIVCVLNAETLRNPYSNARKALAKKLLELNATITYHEEAFVDADRSTNVEVAIVHILREPKSESDKNAQFFSGMSEAKTFDETDAPDAGPTQDVEIRNNLEALVHSYNLKRDAALNLIDASYQPYVPNFMKVLTSGNRGHHRNRAELTNTMLEELRSEYWRSALRLDMVRKYLTTDGLKEFERQVELRSTMDFTLINLMTFLQNLSRDYNDLIGDTVVKVFDEMTRQYAWDPELHNKNVLYFNGWKTNDAFKVDKKVVLPVNLWDNVFGIFGNVSVSEYCNGAFQRLLDIEKVLGNFASYAPTEPLKDTLERALKQRQTRKIACTYFELSLFKKGTVHLTFTDPDVIRRFNVFVCDKKGWLPFDYGKKKYQAMDAEEQAVVESFEGKSTYEKHRVLDTARLSGQSQAQIPLLGMVG